MFKHQGASRTDMHNVQIASVLSFVAGLVNVVGFLSINHLTTNVTGHFAYFMNDVSNLEFWKGTIYFLYILSFLLGAFVSSLLIESMTNNKHINIYVYPTLLESALLVFVALFVKYGVLHSHDLIACLLLFAMGVQNSFVTRISNAVVRTTHLTGLITDLGIDLSRLVLAKRYSKKERLNANLKLRVYIISFFFLGGVFGGVCFKYIGLDTLFVASIILLLGLVFDDLKYRILLAKRHFIK